MTKRINIDADQRNADWLKTLSWDLPTDKDVFLAVIGGEAALDHFMTLPAAEAMPTDLRGELHKAGLLGPKDTSPHQPHPAGKRYQAVPKTGIIEPPTRTPVIPEPPKG